MSADPFKPSANWLEVSQPRSEGRFALARHRHRPIISGVSVALFQKAPFTNMPRFTAEASLANPSEGYRIVRRFSNRDGQASVIPAMPARFCANMGFACDKGNGYACIIFDRLCPDSDYFD